ncbi:MAG: hypothetical protein ACR2RB_16620 [Gammaproteobacteria bacterium]
MAKANNSTPERLAPKFQAIHLEGGVSELTTMHELKPGGVERIRAFLASPNGREVISTLEEVHFARWFVIDGDRLVFCSDFVGQLDDFFARLAIRSDFSHNIWRHCVGCPAPEPVSELMQFIASGQIQTLGFYCAYPTLSVPQIRKLVDWQRKFMTLQKELARPMRKDSLASAVGVTSDPLR